MRRCRQRGKQENEEIKNGGTNGQMDRMESKATRK